MKTGILFLTVAVSLSTLATVRAQNLNYLGSAAGSWTAYAAGTLPTLNTTAPGSVTGAAAGWRYARSTAAAGTVPGTWRAGDTYSMQFNGTVGNGTVWRMEFSDPNHLDGLQLYVQNLGSAGADKVSVWSMGTATPTTLFTGDLGGASGVGNNESVIANLAFKVLAGGTTASVSGSLADSTGQLWSSSGLTINLGTTASSIYGAFNLSTSGSVTGISAMSWGYQAVPEPQTWTLFASLGVVGFGLLRRRAGLKS